MAGLASIGGAYVRVRLRRSMKSDAGHRVHSLPRAPDLRLRGLDEEAEAKWTITHERS